jgi:biotin-[acetyl-CoA-carboxylase] ligase BirA-like protein
MPNVVGTLPIIERIDPSKVKRFLRTKTLGRRALYFRSLSSTNDVAKGLATKGIGEGTIVVTETQTEGKGRLGRKWASPKGGLWFSIILRPRTQSHHVTKLTLLASVAVAETMARLYRQKVEIKWPNDVLVNGKKACGILTEGKIRGEAVDFAVLGIGINANFSLDALPLPLQYSATTLKNQLDREVSREALLCELLGRIEFYYNFFIRADFDAILNNWRSLAAFLGSYVEVRSEKEKMRGWAVDIDNDGALIVRLRDKMLRKVTSGEITAFTLEENLENVDE